MQTFKIIIYCTNLVFDIFGHIKKQSWSQHKCKFQGFPNCQPKFFSCLGQTDEWDCWVLCMCVKHSDTAKDSGVLGHGTVPLGYGLLKFQRNTMPSKWQVTPNQCHSKISKNNWILNKTNVETSNLAFTYSCWKWNSKVFWCPQLICSNTNWCQFLHQSKYLCVIITVLITHHVKNHVMQAAHDVAAVNRNKNII